MNKDQLNELLYQAFETELGGVSVYEAALRCVQNKDLPRRVGEISRPDDSSRRDRPGPLGRIWPGIPDAETHGRTVVRHVGTASYRP